MCSYTMKTKLESRKLDDKTSKFEEKGFKKVNTRTRETGDRHE